MKDLLIIADSIVHVNFFGLALNIPSEYKNGYIAMDSDAAYSVYVYSSKPVIHNGTWNIESPLESLSLISELSTLVDQLGLTEWPKDISSRCYSVESLIIK